MTTERIDLDNQFLDHRYALAIVGNSAFTETVLDAEFGPYGWDHDQVAAAHAEAVRKLQAIDDRF